MLADEVKEQTENKPDIGNQHKATKLSYADDEVGLTLETKNSDIARQSCLRTPIENFLGVVRCFKK